MKKKIKFLGVLIAMLSFFTCTGFTMGINSTVTNEPTDFLFFARKYHPVLIQSNRGDSVLAYAFEYNEYQQVTRSVYTSTNIATGVTNSFGDCSYKYDYNGNMISRTMTEGFWNGTTLYTYPESTECFKYDEYGNMIARYIPNIQMEKFNLTFDENHNVLTFNSSYNNNTIYHNYTYTYNELGQVSSYTMDEQTLYGHQFIYNVYTYNALGDVSTVYCHQISSPFSGSGGDYEYHTNYDYQYDELGRPIAFNGYIVSYE